MSIDLNPGLLFRVTDDYGRISETPFANSSVANRLRKHLENLDILDGEIIHSFRSGRSITLSLLGASYSEVAKHIGWKSVNMAMHYGQLDKVMTQNDGSSLFARYAAPDPTSDASTAEKLGQVFRERNFLQSYKPIFG